jgi:hypothetical protein
MDDLTANNETVLASLSGATTMPESKNEEETGGEAMGLYGMMLWVTRLSDDEVEHGRRKMNTMKGHHDDDG